MNKIIVSLFLYGLAFGCGPCMASCGPILVSYVAGSGKNPFKGFLAYSLFSLGRLLVYLALSALVFFLGNFAAQRLLGGVGKFVMIGGGIFIALIGILITLNKHTCFVKRGQSIFLVGIFLGLLPCAPLLAILSYIGLVSKEWYQSLLFAFSFGIGTIISPLILLVLLSGLVNKFLADKRSFFYRIFNLICGLVLVILGIQLIIKGSYNA